MFSIEKNKVQSLMKSVSYALTGRPLRTRLDYGSDSMASIHLRDGYISFNPKLINDFLNENEAYIRNHWYRVNDNDIVIYFTLFLTLHELGHYHYSPFYSEIKDIMTNTDQAIPESVKFLCSNIVEDSHIQDRMKQRYPSVKFDQAWGLGETLVQGDAAVQNYITDLQKCPTLNNYMMYFIYRAYNRSNQAVQDMWDGKVGLPWSQDTISAFEQAITIYDKTARAELACNDFARGVLDDIKQLPQNQQLQLVQASNPQNGQNGQNGQAQAGQGQGQGQPIDINQALNDLFQKVSDELNKHLNNSVEKQQNDDLQNNPVGPNGGGCGRNGQSELHDNDANHQYEDSHTIEDPTRLLEDIDDSNIIIEEMVVSKIEDAVIDKSQIKQVEPYTQINQMAQKLYQKIGPEFAQIHNEENFWKHGLEDGAELDEDKITDFYTEKALDIYQEFVDTRETRQINVTFLFDNSASMGGSKFADGANIVSVLCHAFEEADIQTQVYMFESKTHKLKDFTQPAVWFGESMSNILLAINQIGDGGGTDINPALKHYIAQDINKDKNVINLLFIVTDGGVCDPQLTKQLTEQIYSSGAYVRAIGLDLSHGDISNLKKWLNKDDILLYTSNEIVSKLGYDIAELVDDIIHHRI